MKLEPSQNFAPKLLQKPKVTNRAPAPVPELPPLGGTVEVELPDVGEESLEILLDWYEKHFLDPYPNKCQLKKMSELTGLNKSEIRHWASEVRKVRNF